MGTTIPIDKILLFWNWFEKMQVELSMADIGEELLSDLDLNVGALGDFVWEIGPGTSKDSSFTLSPNGNVALLKMTQEIVSRAPNLPNWEFYFARQPKEWSGYFEIMTNSEAIKIDIREWRYVLYKYDDGMFEIEIMPIPYQMEIENDIDGIVEMVLTSVIGEELRLKYFDNVFSVKEFTVDLKEKSSGLKYLSNYLHLHLDNESTI